MACYKVTNQIIYPILFLVILTLIVGFIHTYGSVWLLKNDKKWKTSGIPLDPPPSSPEWLILIKNNLINLFEFPVLFYVIATISFVQNIDDALCTLIVGFTYCLGQGIATFIFI